MVLFGPEHAIREAVEKNLKDAGREHHILNVGHGVIQGTPEEAVKFFCQLCRESSNMGYTGEAENSVLQGELLQV